MKSDLALLEPDGSDAVLHLFRPYINSEMRKAVVSQLETRWVGQGPRVDEFERGFETAIAQGRGHAVAVNSATAGLHIAYMLALGSNSDPVESDAEVACPVFTCTATNLPWLYLGCKIRWVDVDPDTLNVDLKSLERSINEKTKAISLVHYGGLPVDVAAVEEMAAAWGIPVIHDAAQALGTADVLGHSSSLDTFTVYSFQAIKHITTGDGGMLIVPTPELAAKAKRLRWFGIDREAKQSGIWENDIWELGFKYQMTDLAASMGLAALPDLGMILAHRQRLLQRYRENILAVPEVRLVGPAEDDSPVWDQHAAWLATVVVDRGASDLRQKLRANGVESNPVHYRNDRYSVFQGHATGDCPNMDAIEGRYLCLPLHMNMELSDVDRVCEVMSDGW